MNEEKLQQINLTDCLQKTLAKDVNLKSSELAVLKCIVMHINKDISKGYRSWPSNKLIQLETGLSITSITKATNLLDDIGWIKKDPSYSEGKNNTYNINAQMIVDAHNKWREHLDRKPVAEFGTVFKDALKSFSSVAVRKDTRKRNTDGLVQNRDKVVDTPVQREYNEPNGFDDIECPF